MSKLKDKLSANMRMVKANQQSPTTAQAKTPAAAKPIKKVAAKPAAAKTAVRRPTASKIVAGDVADSGSTLFPTRVWPD